MARALWRGTISFGLVSIPVGLQAAVEGRDALAFHLLHRKDGSRIDYKRFCAKEDVEVPWDEIVKGYEHGKGRYVALTDADFSATRVEVGTIVLRQREHLVALEPVGSALALTTMRFADEIRAPASLRLGKGDGYTKQELALAGQLIEAMAAPWNPRDYRDTYTEALRRVIRQKLSGKALEVAPPPRPATVVDLRAALEQSLKSPGKRTGDAKRGMRPRARRRRAA